MLDPVLAAADYVTESGDACFRGECDDVYLVHTKKLQPGDIYQTDDRSVAVRIVREASLDEYRNRCPHVPELKTIDPLFIYLGKIGQKCR